MNVRYIDGRVETGQVWLAECFKHARKPKPRTATSQGRERVVLCCVVLNSHGFVRIRLTTWYSRITRMLEALLGAHASFQRWCGNLSEIIQAEIIHPRLAL